MILRTIVGLLTMPVVSSCVQQPPKSELRVQTAPGTQIGLKSGVRIETRVNRGIGYTDSMGTDYNIRYRPITITNEGAHPIHIQLSFSKEYMYPSPYSDERFNVIPLPREWGLDGVAVSDAMINELPKYLEKPSASRTLEPGEQFVAAIGTRYRPTGRGILPTVLFLQSDSADYQGCESQLNPDESTESRLSLGLRLDTHLTGRRDPLVCTLIPAGQVSYAER